MLAVVVSSVDVIYGVVVPRGAAPHAPVEPLYLVPESSCSRVSVFRGRSCSTATHGNFESDAWATDRHPCKPCSWTIEADCAE